MSRGRWDYKNESLQSDMFGYYAEENGIEDIFNDMEVSTLVYDVFGLMYSLDSYLSGDWSKGDYEEDLIAFKKKHLKNRDEKLKDIIDKETEKLKQSLLKMIIY